MVKQLVKAWLAPHKRMYSAFSHTYNNVRFLPVLIRRMAREGAHKMRRGSAPVEMPGQLPLVWRVPFPSIRDSRDLIAVLSSQGLRVESGANVVYLPPQDGLADLIPSVVKCYPPGTGFKILKDFRAPEQANYLTSDKCCLVRRSLMAKPAGQVAVGNMLYSLGLGARIWDVSVWQGEGNTFTVFAVEHVAGRVPRFEQWCRFIETLEGAEAEGNIEILLPNWRKHSDFQPADCRGNLVFHPSDSRLVYVDFQNFRIPQGANALGAMVQRHSHSLHFGRGRPFRSRSYLYQSIPGQTVGKRDVSERWRFIEAELRRGDIMVRDRLLLDVGCNAGMMLHMGLAAGAKWGFGWDLPAVTRGAEKLLLAAGAGRFTLTPAVLDESYDLAADVPERFAGELNECVILYLSVVNNLGIMRSLSRIPWRALVFEGHQGQDAQAAVDALLARFGNNVEVTSSTRRSDGDSKARPILILTRTSPASQDVFYRTASDAPVLDHARRLVS
jgi:hypothetical protein